MPSSSERELLTVAGHEVAISNPQKILFPQAGYTKLDLARY
jgi:bifunctional non-homologous end joining protein LigD